MSSVIRPLTLSERRKPAQMTYLGGFKNVSFQIGEIVVADAAARNTNESTPVYAKAIVRKSPTIQFPIMVPNSLAVLKGPSNTIASVVGQKNKYGSYDALLVARSTERLSSFNSKLRSECLNAHWFLSLQDACEKLEAWRRHYNEERPHSAIGNIPPSCWQTQPVNQPTGSEQGGKL